MVVIGWHAINGIFCRSYSALFIDFSIFSVQKWHFLLSPTIYVFYFFFRYAIVLYVEHIIYFIYIILRKIGMDGWYFPKITRAAFFSFSLNHFFFVLVLCNSVGNQQCFSNLILFWHMNLFVLMFFDSTF